MFIRKDFSINDKKRRQKRHIATIHTFSLTNKISARKDKGRSLYLKLFIQFLIKKAFLFCWLMTNQQKGMGPFCPIPHISSHQSKGEHTNGDIFSVHKAPKITEKVKAKNETERPQNFSLLAIILLTKRRRGDKSKSSREFKGRTAAAESSSKDNNNKHFSLPFSFSPRLFRLYGGGVPLAFAIFCCPFINRRETHFC